MALHPFMENSPSGNEGSRFPFDRYNLGTVLQTLWTTSLLPFRGFIVDLQEDPLIIRFVHLMVNDMTFLLDESIDKLGLLSEKDEHGDERLEQECKYYLHFSKETLRLACELVRITSKPFLRTEIRDRIASVLNYHLVQLVGPNSRKLRIHPQIKERLKWKARDMLSPIISLYGILGMNSSFIHSLKTDARSFQMALLRGIVAMILNSQRGLVTPTDASLFVNVVEELQNYHAPTANLQDQIKRVNGDLKSLDADTLSAIEALLALEEDVPEEFLDPVMATIMFDPVRMEATSKKVVDRRVIVAHLMNDERDPFSRKPLKESDLVPEHALRERIYAWIADKIKL